MITTKTIIAVKLTMILLTAALFTAQGKGLSQTITFTGTDIPIEKLLMEVEKQTGYLTIYNSSLLFNAKPVSISVKDQPLEQFMKDVLKDLPVSFFIKQNTIVLEKKNSKPAETVPFDFLNLLNVGVVNGQTKISGVVQGLHDQLLAGATIRNKRTKTEVSSDEFGKFEIAATTGDALVISYVGYEERTIVVTAETTVLRIILKAKPKISDTVVVSTGLQNIRPERFVGAVVTIDSALFHRQVGGTVVDRLEGITNGLFFNRSSGLSWMEVRGISSINGGSSDDLNGMIRNNPLIIIDNFPFTGKIENINPNDIEKVTILRDAAATSIWGARAGNGVIVFTTKKGNYNRPVSGSVSSNFTLQQRPAMRPELFATSADAIEAESYFFSRNAYNSALNSPHRLTVSPAVAIMAKLRANQIDAAEAEKQLDQLRSYDNRADYDKYVFRNGTDMNHYINLSGGTSSYNFGLSMGFGSSTPNTRGNSDSRRYSVRSSLGIRPMPKLEMNLTVDYTKNNVSIANIVSRDYAPYVRLADDNGNALPVPYRMSMSYADTVGGGRLLDWHYRPLDELYFGEDKSSTAMISLTASAKYRILDGIDASLSYVYNDANTQFEKIQDERAFDTRNYINQFTNPVTFISAIPRGAMLTTRGSALSGDIVRGMINVNRTIGGEHELAGMVSAEFTRRGKKDQSSMKLGYDPATLLFDSRLNYNQGYPMYRGGSSYLPFNESLYEFNERAISLVANASYTFRNKYTLYGNITRDASNQVGVNTNHRWKPLWSLAGKWMLSNETFFKPSWISSLALRLNYGIAGNVQNMPGETTIYLTGIPGFFGFPEANVLMPPNPNARWEEVATLNLGIDYGFFNNRVSGSLELYRKISRDLISSVPGDPTTGWENLTKNAGELTAKGIDFTLKTLNIVRPFSWNSTINFNYNRTVLTKFFYPPFENVRYAGTVLGKPLDLLYAYKWGGLDPQTGEPLGYFQNKLSKEYNKILSDSLKNQQYIGKRAPLFFGNFLNSFTRKGFSFSFNITFRGGYYFRKPGLSYANMLNMKAGHADFSKRWKKPGDEAFTNVPSMLYTNLNDKDAFYYNSTINIFKGDHIRLNDFRLAYTWSNQKVGKAAIKSATFFVNVNNLNITLYRAFPKGLDPDRPYTRFVERKSFSSGITVNL